MLYDTLLFGNGLTLGILNEIKKIPGLTDRQKMLCNQNEFIVSFFTSENQDIFCPRFKQIFCGSPYSTDNYKEKLAIINDLLYKDYNSNTNQTNMEVILNSGFEYWYGEKLFELGYEKIADYLYIANNFWFSSFCDEVIAPYQEMSDLILKKYSKTISQFTSVYTLNFDTLLDNIDSKIAHLHGKFLDSYDSIDNFLYFVFCDSPFIFREFKKIYNRGNCKSLLAS